MIPQIHIEDYSYELPDERIAKYPLPERDLSKLLVYKDGECRESIFRNIPDELPEGAMMVFNNTKVVPARLFFRRDTGAMIEIFCLKPFEPAEYVSSFDAVGKCSWKCVIGNSKKWKNDILHYNIPDDGCHDELKSLNLSARLIERGGQTGRVEFTWDGDEPFSRILELCGQVPIPPYLNRGTEAIDIERYQTTYADIRGSVAAPTAGLHFTESILERIRDKGIDEENVCLHVGAGTFLPVKTSLVSEHTMHREPFVVTRSLLEALRDRKRPLIAVGTTSVRTLESLYYIGVNCIEKGEPSDVEQWDPYTREYNYTTAEAIDAIIKWLESHGQDKLVASTKIIIVPGFEWRIADMIVTNFHQPQSTLLLLISSFVGGDWHRIYDFAMSRGFRFLSYGDSSLLTRSKETYHNGTV